MFLHLGFLICVLRAQANTTLKKIVVYFFFVVLQSTKANGKGKKREKSKLSSKLISQNERFYVRRRAVHVSRAPSM